MAIQTLIEDLEAQARVCDGLAEWTRMARDSLDFEILAKQHEDAAARLREHASRLREALEHEDTGCCYATLRGINGGPVKEKP